ncbi:DNA glycosylase [Mycena floridula]|nr:DNA glycosylase [Mycena floridula]
MLRRLCFIMPATRSSSRSASTAVAPKRKAITETEKPQSKKPKVQKTPVSESLPRLPLLAPTGDEDKPLPAKLTFSFEEARSHLIAAGFQDLFNAVRCKPFDSDTLEIVHPFSALASSILGQQISWKAARSIRHKFIRLFDSSIPEGFADYNGKFFPSPYQVATTDGAVLRTAGLSQRKVEYVLDLATRFADGRLSTDKLLKANDQDLAEMLIEIKGVGRWTVDMFAIFSLRRPDILPVGDLGVQRGMLRWFLSLHSSYNYTISPEKVAETAAEKKAKKESQSGNWSDSDNEDEEMLPAGPSEPTSKGPGDASALPPAPLQNNGSDLPALTPSTKKKLTKLSTSLKVQDFVPPALPQGLTPAILKSRLDTKKKIKGALLTPKEMEELTESWRPYRSIGVYYMWALAEANA